MPPVIVRLHRDAAIADPEVVFVERALNAALASGSVQTLTLLLAACPPAWVGEPAWEVARAEVARLQGDRATALAILERLAITADAWHGALALVLAVMASGKDMPADMAAIHARLREAEGRLPPEAQWAAATAARTAGNLALREGDAEQAECLYGVALGLYRACGDGVGMGRALVNMGIVCSHRGQWAKALRHFADSAAAARAAGREPSALLYYNWANLLHADGKHGEALSLVEIGLRQAAGHFLDTLSLRLIRAHLHAELGELAQARRDSVWALHLSEEAGLDVYRIHALFELVDVCRKVGDLVEARKWFEEGEALLDTVSDCAYHRFELQRAALLLSEHRTFEALQLLDGAVEAYAPDCQPWQAAAILSMREAARRQAGDTELARQDADAVAHIRQTYDVTWLPALTDPIAEMPVPPRLVIRCFGELSGELPDGRPLFSKKKGRRLQELLALLLAEPAGVTRRTLIERLYGDDEVSRQTITMLLSRLQQACDPEGRWWPQGIVAWHQGLCCLVPHAVDCELWRFDALIEAWQRQPDDEERVREILRLYRGPIFGVWHSLPWLWPRHERTQRQWSQVVLDWQRRIGQRRDFQQALDILDAALEVAPLLEAFHEAKIRLLMTMRLPAAAKVHYLHYADLLEQELGVRPSRSLADIIQAGG
jgi:tetratricopeptide (TPR) repeat protein